MFPLDHYTICQGFERDLFTAFKNISLRGDVDSLITLGLDINRQRPSDGRSALAIAASDSAHWAINALIESGADMYLKDKSGKLAIEAANPNASPYPLVVDAFCSHGMMHTLCGNK
jgi:hypothetical protein